MNVNRLAALEERVKLLSEYILLADAPTCGSVLDRMLEIRTLLREPLKEKVVKAVVPLERELAAGECGCDLSVNSLCFEHALARDVAPYKAALQLAKGALGMYLSAGCKSTRRAASVKAKVALAAIHTVEREAKP